MKFKQCESLKNNRQTSEYIASTFKSMQSKCLTSLCGAASLNLNARVAKLVDALDLGSSRETCESSSLSSRIFFVTKKVI